MPIEVPTAPPARGDAAASLAGEQAALPRLDASDRPALAASLRQLIDLRNVAIAGQTLAITIALVLDVSLVVAPMALVIAGLVVLNVVASTRLKRGAPATHAAVGAELTLDLAAFTALILMAGGAANPFAFIFLLHVVMSAMLLPWRSALAGTALVIFGYALSLRFAWPLVHSDGQPLSDAALALGLWVSFALTALVTAWFIIRIVAALRTHEHLLQDAARQVLNAEAVTRIGALAAGAAHELGTPLTTMAMVIGEMRREAVTPAQHRDAAILAGQIDLCRQSLSNLRAAAGHARTEGGGPERLDAFLSSVVARFRTMRPLVPLQTSWDGVRPAPEILADQSLHQSLLVLLNNAADASPQQVDMAARWDTESLRLTIADRGSGISPDHVEKLGRAFFTTKPPGQGTGLGLVLTASTVGRLGGTVRWSNRADGGLLAEVQLPLNRLLLSTPPA